MNETADTLIIGGGFSGLLAAIHLKDLDSKRNKQINKSCELSCDESVIKNLDEDGRITYGDALMASLTAQGKYGNFVVSITMSENVTIPKVFSRIRFGNRNRRC